MTIKPKPELDSWLDAACYGQEGAVGDCSGRILATAPGPGGDALRLRAAYVAFLWKRLRAPRPFVNPARKTPFQF